MSTTRIIPATFTAATTSAAIDLAEGVLVGVELPSGFVGTSLTFQGSNDNITFQAISGFNEGSATPYTAVAINLTVAASNNYTFKFGLCAGFRYLKLIAGSGTYTVNCIVRSLGR